MKIFSEFHDGFFEGLLVDGTTAFLFLNTVGKRRSVLKMNDLLSLKMNDFREGNILFDVILRQGEEIVQEDVDELFGFSDRLKAVKKLAEAHEQELVIVEVNPSYGAALFAITKSTEMMTRQAWLNGLVTNENLPSELDRI